MVAAYQRLASLHTRYGKQRAVTAEHDSAIAGRQALVPAAYPEAAHHSRAEACDRQQAAAYLSER